jgi:hypothetical protein
MRRYYSAEKNECIETYLGQQDKIIRSRLKYHFEVGCFHGMVSGF